MKLVEIFNDIYIRWQGLWRSLNSKLKYVDREDHTHDHWYVDEDTETDTAFTALLSGILNRYNIF